MKLARDSEGVPSLADCVAHRCEQHETIQRPLNLNEGHGDSECGACIAEDLFALETDVLWPILDAYAYRLTHHAVLKAKLGEARRRLNLLSPGAGNYLADALEEE